MCCAGVRLLCNRSATGLALVALLAGCSGPRADPSASRHGHEVALAWAAGSSADGFHFAISCPGAEKLVMFASSKFELSCDGKEKITSTRADAGPGEVAGDAAAAAQPKMPSLDCYLVVVPNYKGIPGVLTDMRRAITAKRAGPLDCALIRYD